ncbi:MAG: hypothetical protein K2P12_04745, partial [Clostridia bacterium]|nr:hypothetical protein [Clostridia bacterium]
AIMAIPKKNVATILRLPEKANIYEYTGKVFFTPDNLPKEDGIIFAQGTVYFTNPNNVQMPTINLVAIGQLFVGENVNIDLTYMTGTQKNGDFLYVQELKCDSLNAEFIENLKPKTLLHLGQNRKVKIENDIIVEMLKRKEVFVYYDENITKLKGNKSVITYINSTAL